MKLRGNGWFPRASSVADAETEGAGGVGGCGETSSGSYWEWSRFRGNQEDLSVGSEVVGGELGQGGHCAGESALSHHLRKTSAVCPGLPCTRVPESSSEKGNSREEEHFISLAKCVS